MGNDAQKTSEMEARARLDKNLWVVPTSAA